MDYHNVHVRVWTAAYFWCLCTVLAVVRASCPENALQKARMCTAGLGLEPSTPANAFVQTGKTELVRKACRENKFSNAITCLEDIMAVCRGNSDQEHYLRNMVDVQKARGFVASFCSQLHEYDRHAPCIARLHSISARCVHQQRQAMVTKVKASSNMDFLMRSVCKYFSAAEECSEKVLSKSCSAEAAELVARVFRAFEPPVCLTGSYSSQGAAPDPDPGTSGSPSSRSAITEVTSLMLLIVILGSGMTVINYS